MDAVDQNDAAGRRTDPDLSAVRDGGLLDTRIGLVSVLTLIQPADHRLDALHLLQGNSGRDPRSCPHGRRLLGEGNHLCADADGGAGIASTLLLNVILAWNEAFWTLNLTTSNAAPLTAFIASYSSPKVCFTPSFRQPPPWRSHPILILGWFSQKQLVRGLTFGAVQVTRRSFKENEDGKYHPPQCLQGLR